MRNLANEMSIMLIMFLEGRGGDGTGRGVVASWEVLEDEVPGQRRVPLLVVNKRHIWLKLSSTEPH